VLAFGSGEVVVVDDVNSFPRQCGPDLLAITLGLALEQRSGLLEGLSPLLAGRASVGRLLGDSGRDLLFQAADTLAEELIEVRRDDCEELHAF